MMSDTSSPWSLLERQWLRSETAGDRSPCSPLCLSLRRPLSQSGVCGGVHVPLRQTDRQTDRQRDGRGHSTAQLAGISSSVGLVFIIKCQTVQHCVSVSHTKHEWICLCFYLEEKGTYCSFSFISQ